MQSMSGSFRNLAALAGGDEGELGNLSAGGPLSFSENNARASKNSVGSSNKPRYFLTYLTSNFWPKIGAKHLLKRLLRPEVSKCPYAGALW